MVQWLELLASTAMGMGSIPDQGTKIRHATWHGQNRKKSATEQRVNILTVARRKTERTEEEKRGGGACGMSRQEGGQQSRHISPSMFIVLRKQPRKWRHGPPGGGSGGEPVTAWEEVEHSLYPDCLFKNTLSKEKERRNEKNK